MDINKIQKILCENISMGFSPEYFVMVVNDKGDTPMAYGLTPQHTKRLYQYLGTQIAQFEGVHGEIKAKWEDGIQSPIQTKDLRNPDDRGGKDKGSAGKK